MLENRRHRARLAFSLIELLVVAAVIAALISILLPSMSRARSQSRFAACGSNLHQVAVAIHQYALDQRGFIPVGPDAAMFPFPGSPRWPEWASNQLWIGPARAGNGVGVLVPRHLASMHVLFCPADDSDDIPEELDKSLFQRDVDAYGSYLYRNHDETERGTLDNLGRNRLGRPAEALALDVNSLGGPKRRTNHRAAAVNVVYRDAHVARPLNRRDVFALRTQDYASFPASISRRLDEIICAADVAAVGNPETMPPVP